VSPNAKVQASGKDKAGRTQNIYHPKFRARQEKAKFKRILEFGERLPALRKQVELDLTERKLTKNKVLACIVKLMDQAYFRVGNKNYAQENQTYGITTMRRKHTTITSTRVVFDFVGKSGQKHVKTINDRQIARIIKQLDELPGHEVFQYLDEDGHTHTVTSNDVNEYIKTHMGEEFTAKDFRTWGGTLTAAAELALSERSPSERERKKVVTMCVQKVAKQLGNTPTIARSSYIDSRVINTYMKTTGLTKFAETVANMRPRKYAKPEEICTLELLKNYK
jgi:DNA topoisomerase-1